jgi:uncharacterized protein (TIGR04255 family)
MPKTNRQVFKYAPLSEVAFEISFLPKLKIVDEIANFQDAISKEYPGIEMHEQLRPSGDTLESKYRQVFQFQAPDKKRFVRVAATSFNLVDTSYVSFQNYSAEVMRLWSIFKKCSGTVRETRIGLRYVNKLKIPVSKSSLEIVKYVHPYFDQEKFQGWDLGIIRQEARSRRSNVGLTVRSGIAGYAEDGTVALYILDYDCYCEKDTITGGVRSHLNRFHTTIEKQFLDDVKEPYLAYMRTGNWA